MMASLRLPFLLLMSMYNIVREDLLRSQLKERKGDLTFNDHVDSLKHQLVVEVRHLNKVCQPLYTCKCTLCTVQCTPKIQNIKFKIVWSKHLKPQDQGGTDWPQSHPVSKGTPSAAVLFSLPAMKEIEWNINQHIGLSSIGAKYESAKWNRPGTWQALCPLPRPKHYPDAPGTISQEGQSKLWYFEGPCFKTRAEQAKMK